MRAVAFAVLPLGVAFGLATEWSADGGTWSAETIMDFAVGCVLVVCGAVAWRRRPDSYVGALMSLAGFTWFLGTLWSGALYLHRGPLVHLCLSYPGGRVRDRLARLVVVAAYVDGAIEPLATNDKLTLALAGVVVLSAARLFLAKTGPARRASTPALAAAVGFATTLGVGALARFTGWLSDDTILWGYDIVVAALSIVLVVDLVRGRWTEAVVARLVVDLGSPEVVGTLQARLASALGDPSLILAYRLAGTGDLVDEAGRPVDLRVSGADTTVTPIEVDGEEIAVLVHNDSLLAEPRLLDSVAAAARLAVANARLQAEARAHANELESSRRRLVEAGDAQSRRLEAQLRLGPERRLGNVAALLSDARSKSIPAAGEAIRSLETELDDSLQELREFAHGLSPAASTEGGLMESLRILAERSPIPVEIRGDAGPLPATVESAFFFVSSEALANVAKHAAASRIAIEVRHEDGRVFVDIADDGRGGANPARGSGLRGLADRVEALGGRFEIESRTAEGTRLVTEIPVVASERV